MSHLSLGAITTSNSSSWSTYNLSFNGLRHKPLERHTVLSLRCFLPQPIVSFPSPVLASPLNQATQSGDRSLTLGALTLYAQRVAEFGVRASLNAGRPERGPRSHRSLTLKQFLAPDPLAVLTVADLDPAGPVGQIGVRLMLGDDSLQAVLAHESEQGCQEAQVTMLPYGVGRRSER
jgi:hypothetical protein